MEMTFSSLPLLYGTIRRSLSLSLPAQSSHLIVWLVVLICMSLLGEWLTECQRTNERTSERMKEEELTMTRLLNHSLAFEQRWKEITIS